MFYHKDNINFSSYFFSPAPSLRFPVDFCKNSVLLTFFEFVILIFFKSLLFAHLWVFEIFKSFSCSLDSLFQKDFVQTEASFSIPYAKFLYSNHRLIALRLASVQDDLLPWLLSLESIYQDFSALKQFLNIYLLVRFVRINFSWLFLLRLTRDLFSLASFRCLSFDFRAYPSPPVFQDNTRFQRVAFSYSPLNLISVPPSIEIRKLRFFGFFFFFKFVILIFFLLNPFSSLTSGIWKFQIL